MTATRPAVAQGALDGLRKKVSGQVMDPSHDSYEEARKLWNGNIDKRPGVIVRCTSAQDVAAAIAFGREHDLLLSVRGGGHNVAGLASNDGGLMIDLAGMRDVHIDPAAKRAVVGGGALWGDVDGAAQTQGLAVTGGIVSHTGVAGLTLGGGIGWLMRSCGLTIDSLQAAEVVTAGGEVVRASATENTDLFFGLRGGGGNFGVVTSFEFGLHDVGPQLLCGGVFHDLAVAPEFLRFCRSFLAEAPDRLGSIANLRLAPAMPMIPEHLHGKPVAAMLVCWNGDPDEGEKVLRPLREFGSSVLDNVAVKPYLAHQTMLDAAVPHGNHYYWKSSELPELSDSAIDVIVDNVGKITSGLTTVPVFHLGGAVSTVDESATAYTGRASQFDVNIAASWLPDDPEPQRHVEWVRRFWAELDKHAVGVYVNFLSDDHERVKAAYGAEKYAKLVELKRAYDPDNVFRLNYNIAPGA